MIYVWAEQAESFLLNGFLEEQVALFCIDPPYYGIVEDSWDNRWRSVDEYLSWLSGILYDMRKHVRGDGSLLIFQGVGRPGEEQFPIDGLREHAQRVGWNYRNWITWKKRRAYGKSHDYLFCREEILWFSASPERTHVTFNIPLTNQLRGYPGWDKKHPAKSEFKRVSNVWDDIPELMRPERNCQKPVELLERLIATHSNPGDLVVDCFAGYGTTGIAARRLGRRFLGCEAIELDAIAANRRVRAASAAGIPAVPPVVPRRRRARAAG